DLEHPCYAILFACLLLVVLFATGYPVRREETPYEMFRRQHIYGEKITGKQCEIIISQKKIYNDDNTCKRTNTFIISEAANVKSICEPGGGKFDQNTRLTQSNTVFTVVVCKLKNEEARKPNCQYKAGKPAQRTVVVRCAGGLPVHFQDDNVPINNE
uniref:Ribonuclease A-domain domain-containing protein n=1 Tax=Amphilophus citrinellus TaxID=61819 RepID=A0A3Q0QU01_AMPCI